jgi:hypothetical protein
VSRERFLARLLRSPPNRSDVALEENREGVVSFLFHGTTDTDDGFGVSDAGASVTVGSVSAVWSCSAKALFWVPTRTTLLLVVRLLRSSFLSSFSFAKDKEFSTSMMCSCATGACPCTSFSLSNRCAASVVLLPTEACRFFSINFLAAGPLTICLTNNILLLLRFFGRILLLLLDALVFPFPLVVLLVPVIIIFLDVREVGALVRPPFR